MIEILISLCVKIMVGAVAGEVKKQICGIPLKVAEQIVTGWDGEGKIQLDKVWNWISLTADARAVVEAALNLQKSEYGNWTWNMLELVSAV